jgi:hypothetical protein
MTEEITHDFTEVVNIGGQHYKAHFIDPLDVQKRLRVLGGQMVEAVFDNINMYNHATRMTAWLRSAHRLQNKYPIHSEYIDGIILVVWARYQYVFKTEIKPAVDAYQRQQDLNKMRFL